MKFIDLLTTASSNLWRNKGRTILTIIAIFVGSITISMTLGVKAGVNDYVEKQLKNAGGKNKVTLTKEVKENTSATGILEYDAKQENLHKITKKDLKNLEKTKGLSKIHPLLSFDIEYIQGKDTKKYVVTAESVDSTSNVDLMLGRQPKQTGEKKEIVLPKSYVQTLGFKNAKAALNQQVTLAAKQASGQIETLTVKIVGIRNKSIIQSNQAIVSVGVVNAIKKINETNLAPELKNNYYVAMADLKNSKVDVEKLRQTLKAKGYDMLTIDDQINSVKEVVSATTGVLALFGAIALLAASFGVVNTLYMSVKERTREIGLMKAVGMSSPNLFLSFSTEALLLGFFGSSLGVVISYLSSFIINPLTGKIFAIGLDGFTLVQITLGDSLSIIGIIMVLTFLAGTLPALRAAKLDPITALRYE